MLSYLQVVLNKGLNVYVILVVPKRIDNASPKTKPGKINEELKEKNNMLFYDF